jgi:hypothetical protein
MLVNLLALNERIDVLTEYVRTVQHFDVRLNKDTAPLSFVLAPVSAMLIGIIIYTQLEPDMRLAKGDELDYFASGGSTMW